MRPNNSSGLPAETPRDRERDQPPPPRQASWTNEADITSNNNNNYNQSVTRKVQTFFRGAANGASHGISKVIYSKDAPHSVHYGGEWSNSSLNPFDLTNDNGQNYNASNNDSRPFSAPTRQRQQNAPSRNVPTAALMTEASLNRPATQPQGLASWMNGIFQSQGIPKQVTEVSKSLSDGSSLPTLIEILAGESISGIVDSRNLMPAQKLNNLVNSVEFLRSKGLALPQLENSLSEEVCRGEPTSCTALAQCIKNAYDPNGQASLTSFGNDRTVMTSSSSLGRSHLPSPHHPSASIVSLNPSVATTQNSSLSASALNDPNYFGHDANAYYGTRNSTTLGGGYTTNSSLDILPGTMLDLTPAVSQSGVGARRGVARLPSFSSTQLSKMSVEQRKMRLKQNLLPNQNDGKGSQSKTSTIEPPAAFKKESTTKSASSFPSMEDQLKDLLKGNSEESIIAPGHNSTRFHLDYSNNTDAYGYVPTALEQHNPRHSYPARSEDATVHNDNGNFRNEMSYGVNGTKSSLDMTVETTMTAPTMSYDLSTTELQPRNQNFSNQQSNANPASIQPKTHSLPRQTKNRDRSTDGHFRFDAVDERFGGARYRGSLGSTGGSSASSLNCLDTQMEEALRLYPPSPSSVASSMTPPLPPLSPGDTPPDSPGPSPHSPNPDRNPPIEIPHYAQPPNGRQSLDKRSSSRLRNRNNLEAINKGPPPDLLPGSEKTDNRNPAKGASNSSGGRTNFPQPERIDLKKILPRPGFETAGETTADDSSVGVPEGGGSGTRKSASSEENSVLRQQLVAMETIYKNVQDLVGVNGTLSGRVGGGSKNGVDTVGSGSDEDPSKTSRIHQKSLKRLARLEGHVVTLARSVAHLSSELRSQHLLAQDIETIKETLKEMKDQGDRVKNPPQTITSSERNSSWVASLANPHRVHKLTKFFGEEPPLLGLFLEKLGYERYLRQFEEEKIGMVELPYISEDRLQRLGIPMGPRMRILQEAQGALLNPVQTRGNNVTKNGSHTIAAVPMRGATQSGPGHGYSYYFV